MSDSFLLAARGKECKSVIYLFNEYLLNSYCVLINMLVVRKIQVLPETHIIIIQRIF